MLRNFSKCFYTRCLGYNNFSFYIFNQIYIPTLLRNRKYGPADILQIALSPLNETLGVYIDPSLPTKVYLFFDKFIILNSYGLPSFIWYFASSSCVIHPYLYRHKSIRIHCWQRWLDTIFPYLNSMTHSNVPFINNKHRPCSTTQILVSIADSIHDTDLKIQQIWHNLISFINSLSAIQFANVFCCRMISSARLP